MRYEDLSYDDLARAALANEAELVTILVENGMSPDHRFEEFLGVTLQGLSLLHLAANTGAEIGLNALLSVGADPNTLDNDGNPPLKNAIIQGNEQVAKLLLDNGARVDLRMRDNNTLLHYAVHEKNKEIVQLLLNAGADRDAKNAQGISPRNMGDFQRLKDAGW